MDATPRPSARVSRPVVFLAAYLVLYAIAVFAVPGRTPPIPMGFDVAYMAFRITAAYVLWLASRRSIDPVIARGWLYLAIGQVFAVFGNSTWIWSDATGATVSNWTYLGWTIPQDVFDIAGYWQMMRPRDGRMVRSGDWVDAAILVVACATIAWYFIAARLVTTAYDDAAGVFLFFFDSAANGATLLLAVTLWLRAPRGLAKGAMPRTVIGLLMLAAADLLIEKQLADATYTAGSLLDIWYAAAILCVTLGADAQCRDPAGARERPVTTDRGDAVVFGALVASMLPLAVEVATTRDFGLNPFAASGIGVVALMLLVLWRQRLARQEIELLVTSRVRLEHELWQSQKLETMGRLAGGIAHDFNNILAAIRSHSQSLHASAGDDVRSAAAEIDFATGRAAVLVKRLLTFGHAAAPEHQAVALGSVVTSMSSMLREAVGDAPTLTVDVADDNATVRLAEGQLEQILLNLVINARDATPPTGRIAVSTRRVAVHARGPLDRRGVSPGLWAALEVTDTGTGIDAATQRRLFEPFFTTKADRGGTGLGLATVAGIVHAAGGHIIVESAVGAGTNMTVFLPIGASAPTLLGETPPAMPPHAPHGATILVADDELPIRAALARYLSRIGYRVIEAADGEQALSQVQQHDGHIDLVLTDIRMPGIGGIEVAERIRERHPLLPVLFMTGQRDTPPRGAAAIPAARDTIEKPFDLDVVAERIRARVAASRR